MPKQRAGSQFLHSNILPVQVECSKLANGFAVEGLYDMYAERIEAYRADPPPADWDGVYAAESK